MLKRTFGLVVGLSAALSFASPAVASPAVASPAGASPSPAPDARLAVAPAGKPLANALLTAGDLPAGFRVMGEPTVLKGNMLAGAGNGTPTDCKTVLDLDQLLDPSKPKPALPPGRTATVTFADTTAGAVVSEILATGAPGSARAFVAGFVDGMRRCPKITLDMPSLGSMVITSSPLPAMPVGDVSAVGAFTIKISSLESPMHFRMIAFAKGRVGGTVLVAGPQKVLDAFPALVRKAVRKV